MTGTILAILGAACFGLDNAFIRRGVIRVSDPTVGVLISVPLSLPFFLIILLAIGRVHDIVSFPWQSYVWLSLAGLINFVGGRRFNYIAVQLLGANLATVPRMIAPVVAAALGISILGESLTWEIAVGILLIVGGVIIVSVNPRVPGSNRGGNLSANVSSRGILFGLVTGFCLGISSIFVKMGISDAYSPVAAAFISYLAASIALSAFLLVQEKRTSLFGMGGRTFLFFYLAGLLASVAHLLRYTALSMSPVSVVAPLIEMSPIFLLGFSFLFNRRIEVFNRFIIMGVIITVIGAISLT